MKTIFISSFHPLISRNILATPVLSRLLEAGTRIILLVPEQKKLFFAGEFDHAGIFICGLPKTVTRSERFLRYLALAGLNTRAIAIKRRTELAGSGRRLAAMIGGRRWFRNLLRRIDSALTPRDRFRDIFERYDPDLVFATDVQNENDVRLIREAEERGIPSVGMVRSWDNLAAKGLLRAIPDALAVHNAIEREEAIALNGVPPERIRMVGIPHYDRYLTGPRSSRTEFFGRIGGDPARRLILYAPVGDRYLGENRVDRDVIETIRSAMPDDCQLLVRLPPTDTMSGEDVPPAGVIFDRPSVRHFDVANTELTAEADRHLADTLEHADLVIAGPSTMCVDAALFGKPVILVSFDGLEVRPYDESVRRYYDYEHWRQIRQSGGARFVHSPEAFMDWIRIYLADPERDSAGRKTIVAAQCAFPDGKSSHRLSSLLLEKLR